MNIDLDTKLKLLSGLPLNIERLGGIKPLTLRRMVEVGFTNYSKYLGILTNDLSKMKEFKEIEIDISQYTMLDLVIGIGGDAYSTFVEALNIFCSQEVEFVPETLSFKIGEGILDRDNYRDFVRILEIQNCLNRDKKEEKEEFNPANERARAIIEKIKKAREQVEEAKKADAKGKMDFSDVISAVSSRSPSINKLNVWDLTLYQLYDEYNRLRMVDDYYTSIQAMMNGAEKVELRHWSEAIAKD